MLLQALHRQKKSITYFALDVAADPLIQSLSRMTRMLGKSKYIKCQGLLGSYEDCMTLLEEEEQRLFRNHRPLFLWLGNSITNMPWSTSVDGLRRLLQYPKSELLASIDGNQNIKAVQTAYDLPDGKIRRFVRNGFRHANRLLGEDVFDEDDWDFESIWDPVATEQRLYHVAKRDLSLRVDGSVVVIAKGERIHAITSAKWTTNRVQQLCDDAGVAVKANWIEPVSNFGELKDTVYLPVYAKLTFSGCYLLRQD